MKLLRIFVALAVFASSVTVGVTTQSPQPVRAAQTAPNTTIQNTASATYTDANNVTYTTQSNTVTTLVGNAPTLTVTTNNGASAGTATDAPGQVVTDTYTLTNTGNAAGNFQLTAAGVSGAGNDNASTSSVQYIYNATTYGTLALLNTALNSAAATAVNGTITVGVQYTLSASPANVPGAVTTALTGTITYPTVGGASTQTSPTANNTYSDTVQSDARLDLQKTSSQGGSAPYDITYTIKANDGGNFPAKALSAALNNALGFPNSAGCAIIVDKVPTYGGNSPVINGTPAITATAGTNGYPASGTTTAVYYTTNATGSAGWTTTKPGNPTFVAVFETVTAGTTCLNTNAGSSAGSVPAPAITLSFVVPQPSGPGSGNAGAYLNIANGIVGDNQPTEHILGPGIPNTTVDNAGGATVVTTAAEGFENVTATNGPSGASQITSDKAHQAAGILNGPTAVTYSQANLQASAGWTGSYDGVVATNTTDDFTEASLTPAAFTSINSGTVAGTPNGNTYSSTATVNVANALYNSGNVDDSFTVVATAPAGGWTVQLYPDNAGHTGPGAAAYAGCTAAAASCTTTIALTSGQAIQYWAVYVSPNGQQAFVRKDASIVATSVADGTQTNATHNEIYSGFIVLTKSVVVTSNGCPAGVTPPAGGVCPGGVLTYSVDYRNIAIPGNGTEVANPGLFLITKPGTLIVSEDGAAIGNTWAANTNGLNAPATDTPGTGGPWTSTFTTNTAASTAFTCTIGGAAFQLQAGWNGVVSFAVTIK
jgi:hypothetical protein